MLDRFKSPDGKVNINAMFTEPKILAKYAQVYRTVTKAPQHIADGVAEEEAHHIEMSIMGSPQADKLLASTAESIYIAYINAAANMLSFSAQKKHLYLIPKQGAVTVSISPYGEAHIRIISGVLVSYSDPVIVFDCDQFHTENGIPQHKGVYPKPSGAVPIATYIKLVKPGNLIDYVVFSMDEIRQWQQAGVKQNTRWAKTEADREKVRAEYDGKYAGYGFLKAKTIKHAVNRLATGRQIVGQGITVAPEHEPDLSDMYTLDAEPEPEPQDLTTVEPEGMPF